MTCTFCNEEADDLTIGTEGVTICADCLGEAEASHD